MFVLSTLPDVHNELVSKQSKCDEIMKSLDEKKEFLLKCSKEQEASLRELVQQRKEAGTNWIYIAKELQFTSNKQTSFNQIFPLNISFICIYRDYFHQHFKFYSQH